MSVAPSLNAFVNKALNEKTPVFCKECQEKIHHLPENSI
jgi:hypothetical protein